MDTRWKSLAKLFLIFNIATTVSSVCPAGDIIGLVNGSIAGLNTSNAAGCSDTVGSVCDFACSTGILQGGSSLTCGSDNQWSGDCPRECTEFNCNETELNSLNVTYDCGNDTDPYPLDSECTFSCPTPLQLRRSVKATCVFNYKTFVTEWCYDGWDKPVCEKMVCTDHVLDHGSCTYNSPRIGSVTSCTCDEGFLLQGNSTLICFEDASSRVYWNSDDPPRCVPCKK